MKSVAMMILLFAASSAMAEDSKPAAAYNAETIQVAYSAYLCQLQSNRAQTLSAIKSSNRFSRAAAADREKRLSDLRAELKETEGWIAFAHQRFEEIERSPLNCGSRHEQAVQQLLFCWSSLNPQAGCDNSEVTNAEKIIEQRK